MARFEGWLEGGAACAALALWMRLAAAAESDPAMSGVEEALDPIVLVLRGDALDASELRRVLERELGRPVALEGGGAPAQPSGVLTVTYRRAAGELGVSWDSGEHTVTRVVVARALRPARLRARAVGLGSLPGARERRASAAAGGALQSCDRALSLAPLAAGARSPRAVRQRRVRRLSPRGSAAAARRARAFRSATARALSAGSTARTRGTARAERDKLERAERDWKMPSLRCAHARATEPDGTRTETLTQFAWGA